MLSLIGGIYFCILPTWRILFFLYSKILVSEDLAFDQCLDPFIILPCTFFVLWISSHLMWFSICLGLNCPRYTAIEERWGNQDIINYLSWNLHVILAKISQWTVGFRTQSRFWRPPCRLVGASGSYRTWTSLPNVYCYLQAHVRIISQNKPRQFPFTSLLNNFSGI
jgi:hypothetical protein